MEVDGLWLRVLSRSEDLKEAVIRRGRHLLPLVARLCLTATFFEDALRLWQQILEQQYYTQMQLNCSEMFSALIVLVNLVGQLLGSVLIVVRVWVNVAVTLLASLLLLQMHLQAAPSGLQLLLRNFALLGGLLLLHVDAQESATAARLCATDPGVPLAISRRPQHLMRLAGRILLASMFLTLLREERGLAALVLNTVGVLLMALIVLGLRTRQTAFGMAIALLLWNLCSNAWWLADEFYVDLVKYNHFQTLSVVGGLLLIVVLGPGHLSLEQYKKH